MDILWSDRKRLTLFGLPWIFTKYMCTSEKFIIKSGVFSKKEEERVKKRVSSREFMASEEDDEE